MPEIKRHIALFEDGTVTMRDAAEILGMTYEAVRQWKQKGAPIAHEGGRGRDNATRVKLRDIMGWQIGRLAPDESDEEAGVYSYETERARKTRYQADLAEIEALRAADEIVRIQEVADVVELEFAEIRAGLLNLPSRLAVPLSGEDDPSAVADRVKEEVTTVLQELSRPAEIAPMAIGGEDRLEQDEEDVVGK